MANRQSPVASAITLFQSTLELRVVLLALLLFLVPSLAFAQGLDSATQYGDAVVDPISKPLVLIRFNQRNVYYDRQLYMAVSRAVEVKPDVMFEVVSFTPTTGDPQRDAQWKQTTSTHAQAVVASLNKIGVPTSRITFVAQTQAGLKFDEVHVFVR